MAETNNTNANVVKDDKISTTKAEEVALEAEKKDKNKKKAEKAPKRPAKVVLRTWSKGLGKEASRVTWHNKRSILKDFITILVVCVFLALVFFAIDMILVAIKH